MSEQELTPEVLTPEELQLEEDVINAVMGDGTVDLNVTIGQGERARELSLKFRWPSSNDEQAIARLTTKFCDGLMPEQVADADFELARSRAVIEQLAVGPFEDATWLPPTKEKVLHNGKRELRPDTGEVKSRAALVAFGRKWYEVYNRFNTWLYEDGGVNLRRVATDENLRLFDAVARHLGTHPFDPCVQRLSAIQMHLLLELRHPSDSADETDCKPGRLLN